MTPKMIKSVPAMPVQNIDMGVKFYETKLGFSCQYKDSAFAKLIRDAVEIHLWIACDKSWKWKSIFLFLKPIQSGAESFIAGTHSCKIQVENIDALFDEFKKNGILYSNKSVVEVTDWGTREFATLDLHKNLLTFYENIK